MTAPIPFRTESVIGASTYGVAFAATACLLLLVAGVLIVARRRGWFALPSSALASTGAPTLEHVSSKRISPALTVHAVRFDGHAYLVVEAARGAQASVLPLPGTRDPQGEAS